MLVPSIFNNRFFDDWMLPELPAYDETEHKLYGKHAARVMKTDIQEKKDHFVIDVDLPGFKKDEVALELNDGYLTVAAEKGLKEEDEDDKGRVICRERYTGKMQRSFYVGKEISHEDVKAKFEDGVLQITIPKKDEKKLPEKRTIMIEG